MRRTYPWGVCLWRTLCVPCWHSRLPHWPLSGPPGSQQCWCLLLKHPVKWNIMKRIKRYSKIDPQRSKNWWSLWGNFYNIPKTDHYSDISISTALEISISISMKHYIKITSFFCLKIEQFLQIVIKHFKILKIRQKC